jgi:hypothetical protein
MISIVTASSSSGNNNNDFNNYLILGLLGLSYYVIYKNLKLSK